jgi:hypothetical protein
MPQQAYDDVQGQLSYGYTHGQAAAQGPSFYGDAQGPSFGYMQEQGSSFGNVQEQQGPSSFGGVQEQAQPFYGESHGVSSYTNEQENFYSDFRDAQLDSGPSNYRQSIAPVPQWVEGAPDGGVSVIDRGEGMIPPASDLTTIRRGEIPASEVVHVSSFIFCTDPYLKYVQTAGPARTTTTRTIRRANLPATPYLAPRTPAVAVEVQEPAVAERHETPSDSGAERSTPPPQNAIRLTPDVIKQTMKGAKVLVTRIVFSKHAMTCSRKRKNRLIDKVIRDSVPNLFGPNGEPFGIFSVISFSNHFRSCFQGLYK